jgi:ABC-2 type transport system ATP-binding protein
MPHAPIAIEKVTKHFGSQIAVNQLSLNIAAGEVYALLGPNGAGKTTTIQMLLGFAAPDSGQIHIAGCDVQRDATGARAQTAYIPEQVQLYPQLSGIENLDYFSQLAGHRLSQQELQQMLARVGLATDALHRRAGSYSKGMRQKVGIAIAVAKRARVLLLDEPTSGLDPRASAEFSALLKDMARDGVAVLMATHDLFHAHQVATHWGVLSGGKLLVEKPAAAGMALSELESLYLSLIEPSLQEAA